MKILAFFRTIQISQVPQNSKGQDPIYATVDESRPDAGYTTTILGHSFLRLFSRFEKRLQIHFRTSWGNHRPCKIKNFGSDRTENKVVKNEFS